MPMFDYRCKKCNHRREHFCYAGPAVPKLCPSCNSNEYIRQISKFKVSVEYSDSNEHMENVINPGINEIYSQIGKEAANEDTATLENVFGAEVIRESIIAQDD